MSGKGGLGREASSRKARAARARKLAKIRGKERGAKTDRGTSFEAAVAIAERARKAKPPKGK